MEADQEPFERPIFPSARPAEDNGHPCGPFEPGRAGNPVFDLRINNL